MSNLLSLKEKKGILREYHKRVLATGLSLVFIAFVLAMGELLPSYFFMAAESAILEQRLETLQDTEEEVTPGEELEETRRIVGAIEGTITDVPYRTTILSESLSLRPDGVAINELSFEEGDEGGVLVISGEAETRSALTTYTDSIEEHSRFENVEVPVESLARTTDLPFSVRVIGEF